MKTCKTALAAATIAAALAAPLTASAGPVVGFDPTGTGNYSVYADLWTNVTDTGLATGFIPGITVGPGGAAPYLTELRSQMVVGTMSNSNIPAIVTPPGLNQTFEISKVVRFQELVDLQTPTTAHFTLPPSQSAAMDVDPLRAGVQNLAIYFDQITPGVGSSKSVPGNGVGSVACYGTGSTSAGCGTAPGDPDGDGIIILSGHLVFNDASLAEVAREVSRYREKPLRVSTAASELRLTSVFKSNDTDALLKALPHILPVALRTLPDGSQEIISR